MDPLGDIPSSELEFLYSTVDFYLGYGVKICINYSSQLGASLILLVVLLLVTRPEKRRSAFFLLNACSLVINVVRLLLCILYFTGPAFRAALIFGNAEYTIPQRVFNISVAANVFNFLLAVCVESSLILQVHAVCGDLSGRFRIPVITISTVVVLVTIALHFTTMVMDNMSIMDRQIFPYAWLLGVTTYFTVGNICWFSAIFTSKLAYALLQRRRLNLQQFGPMQIIFIVSCQNLMIPALIALAHNFMASLIPDFGSIILTLVAIFLPLSSMWATASTNGSIASSNASNQLRGNLIGNSNSGSSGRYTAGSSQQRTVVPQSPATTATMTPSTPEGSSVSWIDKELEYVDSPRSLRGHADRV